MLPRTPELVSKIRLAVFENAGHAKVLPVSADLEKLAAAAQMAPIVKCLGDGVGKEVREKLEATLAVLKLSK